MIVADTSILIDLLKGEISSKELEEHGEIATCYPIECELYKGTKIARNTEKGEKQVEKLLERLTEIESNKYSAKVFADLTQEYPEISEFDLMIASICISHNAKLLTLDSDFNEIGELENVGL